MADIQNNRINENVAEVLKPVHFRKLVQLNQEKGIPLSGALNRAVELWLEVEGPIYMPSWDTTRTVGGDELALRETGKDA